jgi:iron complex outermembrane recepter protein
MERVGPHSLGAAQQRVPVSRPARIGFRTGLAFGVAGVALLSLAAHAAPGDPPGTGTPVPNAADLPPPPPADDTVVRTVQITSHKVSDAENAQIDLRAIAGGTNLITSADAETHRDASTADLLSLQPGVYASAAGGEDSIKLSIRGSGINRGTGYFRTGVLFTFDGLPLTGPSGTPYELLEPLGLQYTEIYRGGNSFDQGALALGGGINFVTNTGRTAPGEEIRLELGSWDYRKAEAAIGGVAGDLDYYLAGITSSRAGYEDHSDSRADRIIANLGYEITPDIQTRFFFRYGYTDFAVPGQLTKAQVSEDPSQANTHALLNESRRIQPGSEFMGNDTIWKPSQNSSVDFGVAYQDFPISIEGSGTSASTTFSEWTYGNVAEHLKYSVTGELFGRPDNALFAFYNSTDIFGSTRRYAEAPGLHNYGTAANPFNLANGSLITTNTFDGSSDRVLLASNDLEISRDLWLTTGLAGTETVRNIDITTGAGPAFTGPVDYAKTRDNITPKLGLRYDIDPQLQVFANVIKAVEPRNDWDGVITPSNGVPVYKVLDVNDQSAWTEEIGGRGAYSIFQGSLSYYRSEVRNEILTVTDPVLGVTTEENAASPTTHQGIEFGLDTVLWHDGEKAAWAEDETSQRVVWRQAYTWSNFYFNNDPTFHHNALPGIPPHYYQGQLEYDHPSGFYANFNVQAASNYYIDYANTFKSEPYVIYGARVGYTQPGGHGLEVYLEGRNLGNKHYATDISSPVTNANHQDAAVFDPGDGLGLFSGIAYKF